VKRILLAALALSLLWVSGAAATTVLKMDLNALTEKADIVVYGTVKSVEAKVETGGKSISTYVTIVPDSFVHGKTQPSILVRVPGGAAHGQTLRVFGAPVFETGDRVFLFLQKSVKDPSVFWVTGLFQGRYMLFDADGETYVVQDNGQGAKAFAGCNNKGGDLPCLKAKGLSVTRLPVFTEQVRTLIKAREIQTP
jgi:hypothetical protein